MQTPRHIEVNTKSGMQYIHFDFKDTLTEQLQLYPREVIEVLGEIEISLNVDGLPLFKSSKTTMWPVLCCIHLQPQTVFPVVLTLGSFKPNSLEFLEEMVDDLQDLLRDGLNNGAIRVKIRCIVCDAPARAFVKCIKQYTGYHGCDKCDQRSVCI